MSHLFIVATPIGNLEDMTPRAVSVLRSVSLIAAEDTRHSARLLRAFEIDTPVISHHQHNEHSRTGRLLDALREGDVALITDAGTPAISDPGAVLVRAAREAGHRVVPIPGASAVIAAVSVAGLVDGPFLFQGFLPRSGEERRVAIGRLMQVNVPAVIFESPNRLGATLAQLAGYFGDRQAVVARELTKIHEDIRGGTLADLAEIYRSVHVKGEIVMVIGAGKLERRGEPSGAEHRELAKRLVADGLKPSTAARELARISGMTGAEAYEVVRSVGEKT